jgi:hypothetical protein
VNNTERAHAAALAGGLLGRTAVAAESARIIGHYAAVLHRAKPQHEAEYLRLHTHVQDLRGRAQHRQQRLAAIGLRGRVAHVASQRLLAQADEAAAHMRTLMEVQGTLAAPNLVTTVGKNYLLDNGLAGSAYTAAFFLGLISSTSYTAVAAGDTMASHAGWLEAGATNAPAYSESTRRTAAWSAAASGSKALSAGLVFTFTNSGTVKGPFMTTVSTKDGTTGTLYSAGLFTGGDQPVVNTNTLTVSYTASL